MDELSGRSSSRRRKWEIPIKNFITQRECFRILGKFTNESETNSFLYPAEVVVPLLVLVSCGCIHTHSPDELSCDMAMMGRVMSATLFAFYEGTAFLNMCFGI